MWEAAKDYAAEGWPVLPIKPRGKAPITKHGVYDASTDLEQVRDWWRKYPDANVGIAIPDHILVLDLDSEDALQALRRQELSLPKTPSAKTGRGMHLWYATGGAPVKNTVGLFEGVDVKASGGYVVAPPSVHPSGAVYRWQEKLDASAIAPCPDWLVEKMEIHRSKETVQRSKEILPRSKEETITPRGRAPEDWYRKVSLPVREGRRNQTLAEVSGLLFRKLPSATAAELAYCWAKQKFRPPLPEEEIRRTIDSIAGCELRRRGGQT